MSFTSDSEEYVTMALACHEIENESPRIWVHDIHKN